MTESSESMTADAQQPEASWRERLEWLESSARDLIRGPIPPDEEVADFLGRLRKVEVDLAAHRRSLVDETPVSAGENYRLTETRRATRSYATENILSDVAQHLDEGILGAIVRLRKGKALKLTWQWTSLQTFFTAVGLELKVAKNREVGDSEADGTHVGEIWETKTELKAKGGEDR